MRASFLLLCSTAAIVAALANAQLFGLRGAGEQLVQVDEKTGAYSNVGPAHPTEFDAQGLSSIDSTNGIYYFVGFNATTRKIGLIGQSLSSGAIVSSNVLPFAEGTFIGVGQSCDVDPLTGDVFVSGVDASVGGKHHVLRVSPSTGKTESIFVIGDGDVLGGETGYDPVNKVLWLQFGLRDQINFFGIDVGAKTLKYNISNSALMETITWDAKQGKMVGIGLDVFKQKEPSRTVVTLDSTTGKFHQTCIVPGYFIINAGTAALDTVGRTIFAYLASSTSKAGKPFYLVSIDVDSCSSQQTVGCPEPSTCAWNLGFKS